MDHDSNKLLKQVSVYDLTGLSAWAQRNRVPEHVLKLFRTAFFKKGLDLEDCLSRLPEPAREAARSGLHFNELVLVDRQDSRIDGASKLVFSTKDGLRLETVILRIGTGRTSLCVSSQVGCAAGCAFCATGRMGLMRDLSAGEILDQVVLAMRLLRGEGRTLRNVVFMGMGEPFHNEKAVYAALEVLRDARGFYLAERHLLVSTVGMVAAMLRFVQRFPEIRLALSLHSARQEVRRELMPAAKSQTIDKIRAALPALSRHGHFMIEYLMLEGVNDREEDLAALLDLLEGQPVHINLISYNPHPGAGFQRVSEKTSDTFAATLRKAGFKVTRRYSLGNDIAAACGQLANK